MVAVSIMAAFTPTLAEAAQTAFAFGLVVLLGLGLGVLWAVVDRACNYLPYMSRAEINPDEQTERRWLDAVMARKRGL